MTNANLTIESFQQHIHDRYYETDAARGSDATFMWFIEEVGELATALQRKSTHKADAPGDFDPGENLEEEFADVLAWLCTLANINGVSLTAAVGKKYLNGPGPRGHK